MKILFVSAWWPSRVHPTHGNFVHKHARLVARTHDLTVLTIQHDPQLAPGERSLETRREDGFRLVQVYFGQASDARQATKIWLRLRAYRAGRKSVKEVPDVVHGHVVVDGGIAAAVLARRWRRPYLITAHASRFHAPGPLPPLRSVLAKWACRSAGFVLPVSEYLGRVMQERHGLAGNYRTVSNVVDPTRFHPAGRSHARSPHALRLLHVSSFVERDKNLRGLLAAYAGLPDDLRRRVSLHLAGDGDRDAVAALIGEAGLTGFVRLTGPHSEAGVAELMRTHDAFVLSSHTETQGVVLLEAQASGLPCLATRVGGVPEIIEDGVTGILVPPADVAALRQGMVDLVTDYARFDPDYIRQRIVDHCGETAVAARLDRLYREAVAAYPG